jgi:hypothetical protein
MNNAAEKQKALLNDIENMVDFFASKKYMIHGTHAEMRRYDKYARIMRGQLTKETCLLKAMTARQEPESVIHEKILSPIEIYVEQVESKIGDLENYVLEIWGSQEKNIEKMK